MPNLMCVLMVDSGSIGLGDTKRAFELRGW